MKIVQVSISDDNDALEMKFGDTILLEFSTPLLSLTPSIDRNHVLIELENCCEMLHFPDLAVEPIPCFRFQKKSCCLVKGIESSRDNKE